MKLSTVNILGALADIKNATPKDIAYKLRIPSTLQYTSAQLVAFQLGRLVKQGFVSKLFYRNTAYACKPIKQYCYKLTERGVYKLFELESK